MPVSVHRAAQIAGRQQGRGDGVSVVSVAGWAGLGFTLVAVIVNMLYLRAGLPFPMSGKPRQEVVSALRSAGPGLPVSSVVVPASWLLLTVFGAGPWGGLFPRRGSTLQRVATKRIMCPR